MLLAEIDLENMKKLIALMVDKDLSELQYEHGELKIELKRGCVTSAEPIVPAAALAPSHGQLPNTGQAPVDDNPGLHAITSPMVGTFYATPDPESPPFVTVGAVVGADTTVCLIEAMKVFNEIKAEVGGTIEKIAVSNADAVEYGQPLFYVRPS